MPMQTIQELAATTSTDVRGSSISGGYDLLPIVWLSEINDAAQKKFFFKQFVYETSVGKGNKDVIIPYRNMYLRTTRTGTTVGEDWSVDAGESTDITFTTLNNLNGLQVSPTPKNAGVAISYWALQTNALDLIKAAKDELTYHVGDRVDQDVAYAFSSATAAVSGTIGAQTIYGGDARAESELTAGDKFTVNMIADAKTKLSSTTCKYWNPASPAAEAVCSVRKNPWTNESNSPFILFISPDQENVMLKDSQFTNAAEYGSSEVVMNGEIGKYIGIKVVVTPNVPSFDTSSALDGGSNAGAVGHRCILAKPKAAVALAWAIKPDLRVFDYESRLEKRLVLQMAYGTGVIHADAIVFIDVTDA